MVSILKKVQVKYNNEGIWKGITGRVNQYLVDKTVIVNRYHIFILAKMNTEISFKVIKLLTFPSTKSVITKYLKNTYHKIHTSDKIYLYDNNADITKLLLLEK